MFVHFDLDAGVKWNGPVGIDLYLLVPKFCITRLTRFVPQQYQGRIGRVFFHFPDEGGAGLFTKVHGGQLPPRLHQQCRGLVSLDV
jgi:hypothetical protein